MKTSFIQIFIIFCLMIPGGILAKTSNPDQEAADPVSITLKKYKTNGYEIRGPVQYLGKTKTHITLYRMPPVAYKRLKVISENEFPTSVKKEQFVYVLSKKDIVVLIRLEIKEGNNV